VLIVGLCLKRSSVQAKSRSPSASYFVVVALAFVMVTHTGHLGGIVSGVETP